MADNDKGAIQQSKVTRRTVLKGSAAIAGAAVGSGAITGFPTLWAQNLKDVTLNHVGSSYSAIIDIARQASQDLGFTVEMQSVNGDALVNRVVTQPTTVDIADLEYWAVQKVFPRGVMQGIEIAKIENWDKIVPLFTQGKYPGRPRRLPPGHAALRGAICGGRRCRRHRRRTVRPRHADAADLQCRHARHPARSGRPRDQAVEGAVRARVQGQDGARRHPLHRHHGRRHGAGIARRHQIRRQGQHDQGGDRQDHRRADRAEEGRSLPLVLELLRPVGEPDGLGRGGASSRCGRRR